MQHRDHSSTAFTYTGFVLCFLAGPIGAAVSKIVAIDIGAPMCTPIGLAMLLLASPVLEEIVFRKGVHNYLHTRLSLQSNTRPLLTTANLVTALLFGLLHMFVYGSAMNILTAIPALMLGWIWEASGNRIAMPILLHSWFNLCLVLRSC